MNIESDHFKTLEELIDTIKMWVEVEEEYYSRYFGLNEMNILVEEIKRLNKINKKAFTQIKILLELALEQDSENVNLIDRLKGILDILKGVDTNENIK